MARASAAPVDHASQTAGGTCLVFAATVLCATLSCASLSKADEPAAGDAQTAQQTAGHTVLLTFPLSTQQSQIDEVGQHYGLQLVERKVSQLLDQRLIVYRVPSDRDVDDLVRRLAGDARVASAQLNRHYGPVDPAIRVPLMASTAPREKIAKAHAPPPSKSREGNSAGRPPKASAGLAQVAAVAPTRTSSLGSGMRWPTADEPFLGPGGRNR